MAAFFLHGVVYIWSGTMAAFFQSRDKAGIHEESQSGASESEPERWVSS